MRCIIAGYEGQDVKVFNGTRTSYRPNYSGEPVAFQEPVLFGWFVWNFEKGVHERTTTMDLVPIFGRGSYLLDFVRSLVLVELSETHIIWR